MFLHDVVVVQFFPLYAYLPNVFLALLLGVVSARLVHVAHAGTLTVGYGNTGSDLGSHIRPGACVVTDGTPEVTSYFDTNYILVYTSPQGYLYQRTTA